MSRDSAPRDGDGEDDRYRLVERAVDGAVVGLDDRGRVVTWSAAARELTGYDRSEVRGRPFDDILDADIDAAELLTAADSAGRSEVECAVRDADGDAHDAHVAVAAAVDDDPAVDDEAYALVLRDVTERHAERRTLERRNERLADFVGRVSHDLRNPLSAAIAQLELARSKHPSDATPHLDTVYESLQGLSDRIEGARGFAFEGSFAVERTSVRFRETVAEAWDVAGPTDGTLQFDDLPETVSADESAVKRLLENLFDNAATHAGRDATVEVGSLEEEGFYVEDDGPGIDAERRDGVFDPGVSDCEGGSGVGLSVVAAVAEAHGWRIAVTEGASGGARFEVTLDDDSTSAG